MSQLAIAHPKKQHRPRGTEPRTKRLSEYRNFMYWIEILHLNSLTVSGIAKELPDDVPAEIRAVYDRLYRRLTFAVQDAVQDYDSALARRGIRPAVRRPN